MLLLRDRFSIEDVKAHAWMQGESFGKRDLLQIMKTKKRDVDRKLAEVRVRLAEVRVRHWPCLGLGISCA